jgi:hypothetical protein
MIRKTYLGDGKPVVGLVRWDKGGGPRNVLISGRRGERLSAPFES